jgi:energy-coupling factor transporter ATP-binding protein EcfA2
MAADTNKLWSRISSIYQRRERILVQYREKLIEHLNRELEQLGSTKHPYIPLHLRHYDKKDLKQKEATNSTVEEALKEKSHLVFIGEAGSGKSMLLQYLGLLSARGLLQNAPNLPVLIRLRHQDSKLLPLAQVIKNEIALIVDETLQEKEVQKLLEKGRLLLLFDGINESRNINETVRYLTDVITHNNNIKIIATTRFINKSLLESLQTNGFSLFSIQPLDIAELRRLIDYWSSDYEVDAEKLWTVLQENPPLLSIVRNPLLLRMLLITFKERGIDAFAEASLKTLISRLYLKMPMRVRQLVEQIALYMSDRKLTIISYDAIYQQALEIYSHYYETEELQNDLLALETNGILEEVEPRKYCFPNLFFQEYISAQALKALETKELIELFQIYAGDVWWESLLTLIARQRTDKAEIVADLLQSEAPTQWLLAAKCLADDTVVNKPLRNKTWLQLCDFLYEATPEQKLRTSNVLAQIHDAELSTLCTKKLSEKVTDPLTLSSFAYIVAAQGKEEGAIRDALLYTVRNHNSDVRYQSCRALGAIDTQWSTELLIQCLKNESNEQVIQQILSEFERKENLANLIPVSTLVVLLAELKRLTHKSENHNMQTQAEQLTNKIISDVPSHEVK